MGLGKLLTGEKNFTNLVKLATDGKHANSDLLIKDIYVPNEPPLLGSLTAANFGKSHLNGTSTIADHMASLVQLIGETIILFATQASMVQQVQKIVFVGSTLTDNIPLKNVLTSFREMLSYEPIFWKKVRMLGQLAPYWQISNMQEITCTYTSGSPI